MNTKTTQPTTKATHTPGKWAVQREFDHEPIYIIAPHSGETIATVERHPDGDPSSDVPNARLIAAAPELLEACNLARRELIADAEHFPESEYPELHATLAKVQAAIARATL